MVHARIFIVVLFLSVCSLTTFSEDWMNTTDPAVGSKGDVLELQQKREIEQYLQVVEPVSAPLRFVVGSREFGTVINVITSGTPIQYSINTIGDTVFFHIQDSSPVPSTLDNIPDSTFCLVIDNKRDTARFWLQQNPAGEWVPQPISSTRADFVVVVGERAFPEGVTIIPLEKFSSKEAEKLYKKNSSFISVLDEGFYPDPKGTSRFCYIEKVRKGSRKHGLYMNRMGGSWVIAVKNNNDGIAFLASYGLPGK